MARQAPSLSTQRRDTPFQVVAIWCWYDGRAFHGYQAQAGVRTVQAEVLRAFERAGLPRNPVVAGRTDRGVSARMQVLSAKVLREVDATTVSGLLTPHLPPDLGVVMSREAPQGFHAAFSATSKTYVYRLARADAGDLRLLRDAARLVPGTRDFRVFHFKTSELRPRRVDSVEVLDDGDAVRLRFVGEQFARYMVRMLVGGLTAVARGEVEQSTLLAALEQQVPFHCPTAPAEDLTLWDVGYAPDVDPFSPAERQHAVPLQLDRRD